MESVKDLDWSKHPQFFCLETHLAKNGTSSWFNVGPNARLTSLLCRLLHHLTRFFRFNSVSASVGPASVVAAPATRWLGSKQARQISYKMPRVHFLKNLLNNTVAGLSKKGSNVEGLICWLVPEVMTSVTFLWLWVRIPHGLKVVGNWNITVPFLSWTSAYRYSKNSIDPSKLYSSSTFEWKLLFF